MEKAVVSAFTGLPVLGRQTYSHEAGDIATYRGLICSLGDNPRDYNAAVSMLELVAWHSPINLGFRAAGLFPVGERADMTASAVSEIWEKVDTVAISHRNMQPMIFYVEGNAKVAVGYDATRLLGLELVEKPLEPAF